MIKKVITRITGNEILLIYLSIIKKLKVMTVKELIKRLEKVKDKDIEVIVEGTDPTDWVYYNLVESVGVRKIHLDEEDEMNDIKTKVFVIDGGMF